MAQRQQARHRGLYDLRCRGTVLSVGDLVLVKQTAWRGRHKIQDRWESGEYQVVGQPTPGVPAYTVKSLSGGKTKVLHRNLLLPLHGRIRQEGRPVEGESTDSEEEEEVRVVRPQVARAPKGSLTQPPGSPLLLNTVLPHYVTTLPLNLVQGRKIVLRKKKSPIIQVP